MAKRNSVDFLDDRIKKLEVAFSEERKNLEEKKEKIRAKRSEDIAQLSLRMGLDYIDELTLAGALLYIKEKVESDPRLAEEWQEAGRKFLRRRKAKTSSLSKEAS